MQTGLLRSFLVLREELNFSRAAARLQLSQSALSQQIQRLERSLRVQLFVRTTHHVFPTPAGDALVPEAIAILQRIEQTQAVMRRHAAGQLRHLRLGAPENLPRALVPTALTRYRRALPDVEVLLRRLSSSEQMRALTRGELDVALTRVTPSPRFVARALLREELGVAMSNSDALVERDPLESADLDGRVVRLVPPTSIPDLWERLVNSLRAAGANDVVLREGPGLAGTLDLVAAGECLSLVVKRDVADRADVRWRPINGAVLRITLWAVTARQQASSSAVPAMLTALSAAAEDADGLRP